MDNVDISFNFNKNDLIDATLSRFYESFSETLDTEDYCPERFNKYIRKYIFKNLKKKFKQINKYDKKYQKSLKPKKRFFLKLFNFLKYIFTFKFLKINKKGEKNE